MKNVKRIVSLLLTLVLVGAVLTACGTKNTGSTNNSKATDDAVATTDVAATDDATATETAELEEIIVGATIEPHASILNSDAVKEALAAEGFKIKVVEYTDYVQPNMATEDGSLDANFFQHLPYLNDFNKENGTNVVSVANIHFEPLGIYGGKTATLDAIADGAQIAVPNDVTNEARALLLLQEAGLIKLKDNMGLEATVKDITENPHNIKFTEIEAAQTAKVLQDVDFAVINGNYALEAGLSASKDALKVEATDSEAATTYANIIAVKAGNENTPKTQALIKAVTSEATKKFIDEKWQGAVVPVF